MTSARGILAAGIIAVSVTATHGIYRTWPLTHGTEVVVPASVVRVPADDRLVDVRLDAGRVHGDLRALHGRWMSVEVSPGVKVAGVVTSAGEEGYIRLDFGFAPIALPVGVRVAPHDRANVVLRVLPSGRALLTGVIVHGERY